ncbi:MAG: TorD/DmsD family molecular chaperone [Nitrososphaeria archaeon]
MNGLEREEAISRAIAYLMFSKLFYKPEKSTESMIGQFLKIAEIEKGTKIPGTFLIDELEIEYNRLFVGPGHVLCPPYESVYRKDRPPLERGLVMGPSAVDVQRRYLEAGLQMSKDYKDLPDHIAVELEFMHYLCLKEAEERNEKWIKMQMDFLRMHIKPWYREFVRCIKKHTKSEFYLTLAEELEKFLEEEINVLVED